jgi:hypothetical protein
VATPPAKARRAPVERKRPARNAPGTAPPADADKKPPGRFYFNLTGFPFPLGPFFERETVVTEVGDRER